MEFREKSLNLTVATLVVTLVVTSAATLVETLALASLFVSPVSLADEPYEYPVEQDFIIIELDSSQGSYFHPEPIRYPFTSFKLARQKELLPQVRFESAKAWEQLNKVAWQVFYDHIRPASQFPANGKQIPPRPSSQYSDHEYFWDQAMITMGYARYAHLDLNTRGGLDAFYSVQHRDGFIPREVMSNGNECRFFSSQELTLWLNSEPITPIEPLTRFGKINRLHAWLASLYYSYFYQELMTEMNHQIDELKTIYTGDNKSNPPLAAHAEWQHFLLSRDLDRLNAVLQPLRHQTNWLEKHHQIKTGSLAGLFWQRTMSSGMDNMPSQFDHWKEFQKQQPVSDRYYRTSRKNDASFDISAQMKLHYDAMYTIEHHLGNETEALILKQKSMALRNKINHCMWDSKRHFYFNVSEECSNKDITYALSGYWALYAEIASDYQAEAMLPFLQSPNFFNSYMPFSTLAKNHSQYSSTGNYWQGGVWPPLNYITIKGLMKYAERIDNAWDIAVSATERYLTLLANTMFGSDEPPKDLKHPFSAHKQRIFEYNNPSNGGRGNSPDAQPSFVGWGGLGPIALMQEVAIGINVYKDEIVWFLNRHDMHGIENLNIGNSSLSLQIASRGSSTPLAMHQFSMSSSLNFRDIGIKQIRVIDLDTRDTIEFPLQ